MKVHTRSRHGSNDVDHTTIPLVAFGAGMLHSNHHHIHGYPVGSTNVVRRHMLERQRRALCLVGHTDEYLTSQVSYSSSFRHLFLFFPTLFFCRSAPPVANG
jgi:uncharacterized membrane protein YoaK (UPF0700 family)